MKSVAVLSGGLDSGVMLYHMLSKGDDVHGLTFSYGSKHNDMEYKHAVKLCSGVNVELTRIHIPLDGFLKSDLLKSGGDIPEGYYTDDNMKSTVVPFRNGIMLSIATGFAESNGYEQIHIGNHYGDHTVYPDCRASFTIPMGCAIKNGTDGKVELVSPFCNIDKTDIVVMGEGLGVPWVDTYSCYKGQEEHCGVCGTCVERIEAFKNAGIKDPTRYEGK